MRHARQLHRPRLSYLLLLAPYGLAMLLVDQPGPSYVTAWLGSFAILWLTLSGHIKPLPQGRKPLEQIMRPIVLTQIIFVSYAGLSSIFAFLDVEGYRYLTRVPYPVAADSYVLLLAAAQRYYVLAHGALAAGMLAAMDYRTSAEWRLRAKTNVPMLLTVVAIGSGAVAALIRLTGQLPQIANRLEVFALVGSVLGLVAALRSRQPGVILLNVGVYASNMTAAFLSGWKEQVIVIVLLLGVFAYPLHRRLVMAAAPIVLALVIVVLPAYNVVYRQLNWTNHIDASVASRMAYDAVRSGNVDLGESAWDFLVHRASEIGMFARYIEHTPSDHPFYGLRIVEQTGIALIPRVVWPQKPNAEELVMQRTYQAGIASQEAAVSAKPHFVVDAYLSAGALGVAIACFIYGLVAAYASRLAERWFGGYTLGSGLMYTALFISMWRGNCFEFLTNDVAWGFILMYLAFSVGRRSGWLVRTPVAERGRRGRVADQPVHATATVSPA
jgi:hypothetical protein